MINFSIARYAARLLLCLSISLALAPAQAADVNAGRKHYQRHCASCHGPNGKPVMAGAADFSRGEGLMRPDDTLIKRIRIGKRACPSFRGILKDQDIQDVIAFLRTLS